MKNYKIKICIPCKSNNWQAHAEERLVQAENFNQLLDKAMTAEEHRRGARIFEIWEQQNDRYLSWTMISNRAE